MNLEKEEINSWYNQMEDGNSFQIENFKELINNLIEEKNNVKQELTEEI